MWLKGAGEWCANCWGFSKVSDHSLHPVFGECRRLVDIWRSEAVATGAEAQGLLLHLQRTQWVWGPGDS